MQKKKKRTIFFLAKAIETLSNYHLRLHFLVTTHFSYGGDSTLSQNWVGFMRCYQFLPPLDSHLAKEIKTFCLPCAMNVS